MALTHVAMPHLDEWMNACASLPFTPGPACGPKYRPSPLPHVRAHVFLHLCSQYVNSSGHFLNCQNAQVGSNNSQVIWQVR